MGAFASSLIQALSQALDDEFEPGPLLTRAVRPFNIFGRSVRRQGIANTAVSPAAETKGAV